MGDKDADKKLSGEEFAGLADAWFDQLDPERIGRITQEEFLARFAQLLAPGPTAARGGRGVAAAANSLGFFTVVDRDQDRVLQRAELKGVFETWLRTWDTDKNTALEPEEIVTGLNAVLPRTNLSGTAGPETADPIAGLPKPPPSPILPPPAAMGTIQLVDGFRLELAASEPLIEDPVALSFDEDGRAYVVEMRGYMLDIDRTGERDPISRISRLEDTDGDGRFDQRTVFVDGLVLPRAVAATAGGILYVSDYQLYFARDTDGDGKADQTELVDADYGRGNVEHAPNALFRAMDNWIYNGESPYRYRWVNGTLLKQETEVRGQWGMTQDNYGRLFYNVNNSQLLGDLAPPNYLNRNPHHASSSGVNLFVATDQRVFPIRMTTAVNRGYSPEVLNAGGKVYVFASSCSPLIYRGDNFPAGFAGNAFVADPAVNLIKRNLVFDANLTLTSKFAYPDREFLSSTDERFRPVNLYNAPDGTLWFIDLYHGVAQYSQFMTAYLRRETLARGLDKGIHHGRIYRVVSTAKTPATPPRLARESVAALVNRLSDANGWIRDTAQRLLVERGDRSAAPALLTLLRTSRDSIARIHALWTLEGIFAAVPGRNLAQTATPSLLKVDPRFALEASSLPADVFSAALDAIADVDPKLQVTAIRVAESLAVGNAERQVALLQKLALLAAAGPETSFQIALSAGNLTTPGTLPLLAEIATRRSDYLVIRDAIVSGLQGRELAFLQVLFAHREWATAQPGRSPLLEALASAVIKERNAQKIQTLLTLAAEQKPEPAWRTRGVAAGMASNLPVQPARLIALPSAPAAFGTLAQFKGDVPALAEQIKSLFAWPGHQSDRVAKPAEARALTPAETASIESGATQFQQLCAGCHGLAGQGVAPMAPPLVNSDWVVGSESRLIRIVLHGMTGSVTVNGTMYQPPNILPEMPGLATLDDAQLAGILSYVRQAWGNAAAPISPAQVGAMRSETRDRVGPWTEAQLRDLK